MFYALLIGTVIGFVLAALRGASTRVWGGLIALGGLELFYTATLISDFWGQIFLVGIGAFFTFAGGYVFAQK